VLLLDGIVTLPAPLVVVYKLVVLPDITVPGYFTLYC
jgi:hypothetical protein